MPFNSQAQLAPNCTSAPIHQSAILERLGFHVIQKLASATATLEFILFFFIAAYLNPCTKKALKKMMVTNQYQELRGLILDMMIQVALKKETQKTVDRTRQGDNKDHTPVVCPPGRAKSQLDFAFEGLYDSNDSESEEEEDEDASNENSILIRCDHQLATYDLLPSMQMNR